MGGWLHLSAPALGREKEDTPFRQSPQGDISDRTKCSTGGKGGSLGKAKCQARHRLSHWKNILVLDEENDLKVFELRELLLILSHFRLRIGRFD